MIETPLSTPTAGIALLDDPDLNAEATVEIVLPDDADPADVALLMGLADNPPPDVPFDANLAEHMDSSDLGSLASDLVQGYRDDENARSDWAKTYAEGIKLLGLKYEERMQPWPGACGVFHPLLAESVVKFQAECMTETFPAAGPVRTLVIGRPSKEKDEAARRVQEDMNYQLTELMPEYRLEHEKMLWNLPFAGSAFKKVYFDPSLNRQISIYVGAEDVLLPYGTSSLNLCPRLTHRLRRTHNELKRMQQSGFYIDTDLPEPGNEETDNIQDKKDKESGFTSTFDDRHLLLEFHVELDLPGFEDRGDDGEPTGIALPYVVTVHMATSTVLSVYRNWREDDPLKLKRDHFVHYQYIPGFGAYGFGLVHLIGGQAKAATSITRQMIDAGTLANLPGGLKTRGLRIKSSDDPIAPGEFRDVDVTSGTLKENIVNLPYKEPSQVLNTLLQQMVDDARRFAGTADLKLSDMSAQAPVGTTLAIIERTLKVMGAVQSRVHFSLKQELKLLASIIRDYAPEEYQYDVDAPRGFQARKADYSVVEIIPVSDPNAATMAQRIMTHQAALQLSQTAPQMYDMPYLHRQMLEALGMKQTEKCIPNKEDIPAADPVTENMNVLMGKGIKVFAFQDHDAHLAVHTSMLKDPIIQQSLQGNPQAPAMTQALMAHIAEHTAHQYRARLELSLGVPLPAVGEVVPPEVEQELSKLQAAASGPMLAQAVQQAQAAQQQAAAQDPVLQMQQTELQIKQAEMQRKAQNDQFDYQVAMRRAELEQQRINADTQRNQQQLVIAKIKADADRDSKERIEGFKAAVKSQGKPGGMV